MIRERAQVEQLCRQYEADYKSQMQEVQEMQDTLNRTTQTVETLSKQKEDAQHRLDELIEQRNSTQIILDDTKHKCKDEREQLDALKRQMGNQTVSIEEKRDDLKRLQSELNDLIREESSLREQVQQHNSRLSAIEKETSSTETQVTIAEEKNDQLESLRSRLQTVLQQYEDGMTNPHKMDASKLPDSTTVDKLLTSSISVATDAQDKTKISNTVWNTDDPFMKDDPFSAVVDPFDASATDHPFSSNDPFSSHDPFSSNNGWMTDNTKSTNQSINDKANGFSIGNIDDMFKNMNTDENFQNHFESNLDPFGFGDAPFDFPTEKSVPPPRPTKAPQTTKTKQPASNAKVVVKTKGDNDPFNAMRSETDQLSWAKQESEREARNVEAARKREQADLEMALKLSQMEYKTHERKKTSKNKK